MFDHYILNPGEEFYPRFRVCNRLPSFPKNIDVTPGQIEPIINRQEGLTLVWVMKWGLIPFWAKERGVGGKMFNVSVESLTTKLGFRKAFKTQRCLVPSNGFDKMNPRSLFSFAGIYDVWQEPVSGHEVYTYAIITNNSAGSKIDRVPVILHSQDEQVWLNEKTPTFKLESLLRPLIQNL